jgi:hypothetical protein
MLLMLKTAMPPETRDAIRTFHTSDTSLRPLSNYVGRDGLLYYAPHVKGSITPVDKVGIKVPVCMDVCVSHHDEQ